MLEMILPGKSSFSMQYASMVEATIIILCSGILFALLEIVRFLNLEIFTKHSLTRGVLSMSSRKYSIPRQQVSKDPDGDGSPIIQKLAVSLSSKLLIKICSKTFSQNTVHFLELTFGNMLTILTTEMQGHSI